ncbi:MAG: hypothetical protein WA775_05610 [Psychroserpens sp.]|uniref:hypothetical protein n=1 Tax=Psychroserpens sp. TaxID=2020870 RepID=UPI003C74A92E
MKHLHITKKLVLVLLVLTTAVACSKDDSNGSGPNEPIETSFYFLTYNETNGIENYALLVNDNVREIEQLTDYQAVSIDVENGDVHIAGYYKNNTVWNAAYWVNGASQPMPASDIRTFTTDNVFVNGKSFITGRTVSPLVEIKAKLWVDGTEQTLETPASYNSFANAIAVSNTTTLIGGWINEPNGNSIAVLWENGTLQQLTDGSRNAIIQDVFIENTDTYVAGYDTSNSNFIGKVWKNGVELFEISTPGKSNIIQSFFVEDGDVYSLSTTLALDGSNIRTVDYYKNGVFQYELVRSTTSVAASKIMVMDNAVFSLGGFVDEQGIGRSQFFKDQEIFEDFNDNLIFDFVIE